MAGSGSCGAHIGSLARPCWRPFWSSFRSAFVGFHSDNGSEFINHTVAAMLNKLLIEQTKSTAAAFQRQRTCGIEKRSGDSQAYGLRSHRLGITPMPSSFYEGILQSVSEFSPAMWSSGVKKDGKGKIRRDLQLVRHAMGNTAATARAGRMAERQTSPWIHLERLGGRR